MTQRAGLRLLGLGLLLALGLLGLLGSGCQSDSEILCGRWQSRPALPAVRVGEVGGILPSGLELYLGHYGPDVVGVVRFYDRQFHGTDDCGINDPPAEGCGCAYIANGTWNEGKRRFTFRIDGPTTGSDPEAEGTCLPASVGDIPEPPANRLELDLTLSTDDRLSGHVHWVGQTEPTQPLVFERLDCQTCEGTLGARCE